MSKTRKMLELIQVIQAKQQFSVQQLADEFDVSYRTMLRYLHELSGMGIPLYAETGKHGGYRLLQSTAAAGKNTVPMTTDQGVQVVIKPMFRAVGMEFSAPITSFRAVEILMAKRKRQMYARLEEIPGVKEQAVHYGLFRYVRNQFIYVYAVEVPTLEQIPKGMTAALEVPTRRYATFIHRGSLQRSAVDESWLYAICWLNREGYIQDHTAYHLEIYNAASGREDELEIYVPLQN